MPLGAPKEAFAQNDSTVALVAATETVVCTLTGIDTTPGGDTVMLSGNLNATAGTGTTGLRVYIRRGTGTSGPIVGTHEDDSASASGTYAVAIQGEDTPGEEAGGEYVLTLVQLGATANGSCLSASLSATY